MIYISISPGKCAHSQIGIWASGSENSSVPCLKDSLLLPLWIGGAYTPQLLRLGIDSVDPIPDGPGLLRSPISICNFPSIFCSFCIEKECVLSPKRPYSSPKVTVRQTCVEFCHTYFRMTAPMHFSVHELPPWEMFLNSSHYREVVIA